LARPAHGPGRRRRLHAVTTPGVVAGRQALGSLYLGGMSASLLASAGRIRGDHESVGLLPVFRTGPEPFNTFVS
jgi:hypothetical protein